MSAFKSGSQRGLKELGAMDMGAWRIRPVHAVRACDHFRRSRSAAPIARAWVTLVARRSGR